MKWPMEKLGIVAPAKPSKSPKIADSNAVWLLNLDMVESHTGRVIDKLFCSADKAGTSTHWFDENYVLYSKLRPYLNKVVVPDGLGLATTELVPMLPDPERLDRKYLAYYLRSDQFVRWVNEQVAGAKMPRVSMKIFWEHEIPLPPLEEQKRIVTILDKADAIRQKRQQAIALADDFLRSTFLDMFGDPVTNPKRFPQGTIRDLVESANYGSSAKASEDTGDYPILRMGNITYQGRLELSDLKFIDLHDSDKEKFLVRKGDLLFNRTNSKELVGKTAVFEQDNPMAFAGYLVRIRTNELGSNYYLSGYLNSAHGKKTLSNMCKSIVGMANINAQELQNIRISLPPIELQNRFEIIVKETNRRLLKHEKSRCKLEVLFASLTKKYFSGEL